MMTLDERLYHACMRYCEAFTEYICRYNEFNYNKYHLYTSIERERILDMEKRKLSHYYTNLLDVIKEIEGDDCK